MAIGLDAWVAGFPLWLADLTVKATVVLVLAWLVSRALARSSAAVRHRVWGLALGVVAAFPVLALMTPGWRVPLFRVATRPESRSLAEGSPVRPVEVDLSRSVALPAVTPPDVEPALGSFEPTITMQRSRPSAPALTRVSRGWSVAGWSVAIWAGGMLAVLIPTLAGLVVGEWRRHRLPRVGDPAWLRLLAEIQPRLAIRRRVVLVQTEGAVIPLTWGMVRPVVLVPGPSVGWPEATRRLVLLHELAHVARGDVAWQLLARFAAAVYWFHPLAWLAAARLRAESEQATDDQVVATGVAPATYAGELLALARSCRPPHFGLGLAMARSSSLELRMTALFDDTRNHALLSQATARQFSLLAAWLAATLGLVHAGFAPAGQDAPRPPAGSTTVALTPALDPPPAQVPAPPAEASGRIEGRVVDDPTGLAPPTANVILLDPPPPGETSYIGKLPMRQLEAKPDGGFTFERIKPGRYRVWANRGNQSSRTRKLSGTEVVVPEAGPNPRPVELRLKPGVSLAVRVKDQATGRPIPNATLRFGWADFVDDFTSDAAGLIVARPLTPEKWFAEVWAAGFARTTRWINLESGADADAEFLLGPGGTIAGSVRDRAGRPIGDVAVGVTSPVDRKQFAYLESDEGGRFVFDHLPINTPFNLHLRKLDYLETDQAITATAARQTFDLTLSPRPDSGSVAGLVTDSAGRPVAGAEIQNVGDHSADRRQTTTGGDGRFTLDNLFDSQYHGKSILVRAKGLAPQRLKVTTGPRDKPAELKIRLEPGHMINGRAVDDQGRPLAGVRVDVSNAIYFMLENERTTTDTEGRFAFDSLPATSFFRLARSGYSEVAERVLPLDTKQTVDVILIPVGVLMGRVVEAGSGRPVPAFTVRITFSPLRREDEPSNSLISSLIEPGQAFQSAEGWFRIGDLVARMPLQVMVSADGYERTVVERVEVGTEIEGRTAEIRLVPLNPANLETYAGRLLAADGKPVADAEVRLIASKQPRPNGLFGFPFNWSMVQSDQLGQDKAAIRFLKGVTDAQGRFSFASVPKDGDVEIAWWGNSTAPGRTGNLRQAHGSKQALEIKVPAAATIEIRFDRQKYPTAEEIMVSSNDWLGLLLTRPIPSDGSTVTLGNLAPGTYSVTLKPFDLPDPTKENGLISARTLATTTVKLEPGSTAQVDFKE